MMKAILLISIVLQSLHPAAQSVSPDVKSYEFNINLNDTNNIIDCSAVITFNLSGSQKIDLDLISLKANGKGMKVSGVFNEKNKQAISFTHSNDVLRIDNRDADVVRINYKGIPADGLIISKNKFGQRTFFSDNWPNRARNWLVCHDHPSDKASVDFIVTAPSHYQVVSNGIMVEETNLSDRVNLSHWRETTALPMKVFCIGVAEFAVKFAGDVGTVPVYSWVYPSNKDAGFAGYGVATDILPYFIRNIAPYPFRKLANVQSKTVFGGMENAGAIFYSEGSVKEHQSIEQLVAHEVAHQWFGNMATETDWPHLWLSEGFATYFSMLYMESRYGKDTLQKELIQNRNKVIQYNKTVHRPVVDTTVKDYMQLLNANSYEKGGWVLHMLHRQLGDSIFWKAIKTYYNTYAGKNASTDDLRRVFENISGKDLKQFFQQWLYVSGHPVLQVTHSYTNKVLTVTITQQQDYVFEFPLTMIVKTADEDLTKAMRISKKITSFSIPMENSPTDIVIDPFTSLLFEVR